MADRAGDENTEPDVTAPRLPRRSSILKPVRPVLESVENVISPERRRLSKRVSFSDIHQIKLFKCEVSDEQCSGGGTSQAGSVFLPGNQTVSGHAAEDPVAEAVQLLQYDHTPLEQSFYLSVNDGNGSIEAESPTKRTSVLMEEARSCLMFTQHGNIGDALDGSGYQPLLDGTLGHGTMDITCGDAVGQTTAEAARTMLGNKTMETTSIETTGHQSACTLLKTTFGDQSMDMTRIGGTSVLEQTATSLHRTRVFSDAGMDITVGPQDATIGGDATVPLQHTMNTTCPVGSTSFVTGAADEMDAGAAPSGEAAEDNCATASSSGPFDIAAFLASHRKRDSAELLGSKPGDMKSVDTDTSPATAAPDRDEPFNLADFVSLNGHNDASEIIGKDAECVSEPSSAQPVPVPLDTTLSDTCNVSMKGTMKETSAPGVVCTTGNITSTAGKFDLAAFVATNRCNDVSMIMGGNAESTGVALTQPGPSVPALCSATSFSDGYEGAQNSARETDNAHLLPMETSLATDYRAVTMNVTGLDMTTGPAVGTGTETSAPAATLLNRTVMTDFMSMTCAGFLGPEGETDSTHFSPVETSLATNYQAVTMNVTSLDMTTGPAVGTGTETNVPAATLQNRTVMTDVMSMTCADFLGSEGTQNAARETDSTNISPVQTSLVTDYQAVTMNVTGLGKTSGLTVDAGTAASVPAVTLQNRTVMTEVMSMTCANLLRSEEPSFGNHPHTKPAEMTLHLGDGNLSGAMNITCPNTAECPSFVVGMAGPSTEPNEQVHVSPRVVEKSRQVTGEHSRSQGDGHRQVEERSIVARSLVEADRDGDLDGALEHMRLDLHVSMISLNATARDKNGADFSRSMPFLHTPAGFKAGFAASVDDSSEAVPQDLPVPCELTAPSFLKATPKDKPADNIRNVERSTSTTTPKKGTSSKGRANTSAKDSVGKHIRVQASPVDILRGKDSIAYQLLASPVAKQSREPVDPSRRATVVPPSIKKQNAPSKANLTAPADMFNSLTDSTVNVSNVTAMLEMPTGYVSSLTILDDVFSPEKVANGNADARHNSACGSKSLTKARQQMGSASRSRLASDRGQNVIVSREVGANLDKTIARHVDALQDQAVAGHSSSKKSLLAAGTSASVPEVNCESVSKLLNTTLKKGPVGTLETAAGDCPQTEVTTSSPRTSPRAASIANAQCVGASMLACEYIGEPIQKSAALIASATSIRENSTLVAAEAPVQESETLVAGDAPIRKSATFVVASRACTRKSATSLVTSGNDTRPSAMSAASPPGYSTIRIDDGVAVGEGNKDVPSVMKAVHPSASRILSAKQPTATISRSDNSCSDQGASVSRSRKRLEFTAVELQPHQNTAEGAGLDTNGCGEVARQNRLTVPLPSKVLFDVSHIQALPDRGETSCHQLHATSGSVLQRSAGSRIDDGDMLTDVPEPFLVGDSSTISSSADSQHPSRNVETASQQTCRAEVGKPTGAASASPGTDVCIPTNMFYSSSAKKRSKPPSTPSRSSEKCKSTAKKRRPRQAVAKSSSSKRHLCSPVPTSTKRRRRSQEANSAAKSERKAAVSAASASKTRQRTVQTRSTVMDVLQSVFSYQPKLRSLPPSPVASSGPTNTLSPLYTVKLPGSSVLPEELKVPDDLSPQSTLKALNAVQARITQRLDEIRGARAEENPSTTSVEDRVDMCDPPFELPDPQLDLTANIDILGIIDRLDDANIEQTLYWSFYDIPEKTRKHWELDECSLGADKAEFSYIKGRVRLLVLLGDYVKLPDTGDRLTLARAAASGEVRHRAKVITRLCYKITCRRKAQFNQYILQRLQDEHSTDELLKKYPTTDCLGKLLEELGSFIVRYRPLSRDIAIIASDHHHTFQYPVLSYQIIAPSRLIWFHLDLPIDVDAYPNAVIVPSLRPYSDEYDVITTEKLRRIAARVDPGPEYIVRLVDEIDDFLKK
ncbi:hypothetical protein MTO96_027521 [Rhipicephalus appendiculatus]